MWFYKGIKLNNWATKQKYAVAQNLQNKAYTNNHNYCKKHRKFVKLGIQHNRKYLAQNCKKFSPNVRQIGIFSSAMTIVTQTSVNCSYAKASKQQLTAHIAIVKENTTKCYKHMLLPFKHTHTYVQWCYKSNWEHYVK